MPKDFDLSQGSGSSRAEPVSIEISRKDPDPASKFFSTAAESTRSKRGLKGVVNGGPNPKNTLGTKPHYAPTARIDSGRTQDTHSKRKTPPTTSASGRHPQTKRQRLENVARSSPLPSRSTPARARRRLTQDDGVGWDDDQAQIVTDGDDLPDMWPRKVGETGKGNTPPMRHQAAKTKTRGEAHVDLDDEAELIPEPTSPALRLHTPRKGASKVGRPIVQYGGKKSKANGTTMSNTVDGDSSFEVMGSRSNPDALALRKSQRRLEGRDETISLRRRMEIVVDPSSNPTPKPMRRRSPSLELDVESRSSVLEARIKAKGKKTRAEDKIVNTSRLDPPLSPLEIYYGRISCTKLRPPQSLSLKVEAPDGLYGHVKIGGAVGAGLSSFDTELPLEEIGSLMIGAEWLKMTRTTNSIGKFREFDTGDIPAGVVRDNYSAYIRFQTAQDCISFCEVLIGINGKLKYSKVERTAAQDLVDTENQTGFQTQKTRKPARRLISTEKESVIRDSSPLSRLWIGSPRSGSPAPRTRRQVNATRARSPSIRTPPKPKLSIWDGVVKPEKWKKPIMYPEEGLKRVPIEYEDMEKLEAEEFLNDNLITFYMRYLETQFISSATPSPPKIYFFNTHFYSKLTENQKQSEICYASVKKWVKVDLFDYDYLIMPVNENLHWYLAIICNPAKLFEKPIELTASPEQQQASRPAPVESANYEAAGVNSDRDEGVDLSAAGSPMDLDTDNIATNQASAIEDEIQHMSLDGAADNVELESLPASPFGEVDTVGGQLEADQASMSRIIPDEPFAPASNCSSKSKRSPKGQKKKAGQSHQKIGDPNWTLILILDSLGNPSKRVRAADRIGLYLKALALEKHSIDVDLKHVYWKRGNCLNIPRQKNWSDCGVFLLEYIDLFLKDPKGVVEKLASRENPGPFESMRGKEGNAADDGSNAFNYRKKILRCILDLPGSGHGKHRPAQSDMESKSLSRQLIPDRVDPVKQKVEELLKGKPTGKLDRLPNPKPEVSPTSQLSPVKLARDPSDPPKDASSPASLESVIDPLPEPVPAPADIAIQSLEESLQVVDSQPSPKPYQEVPSTSSDLPTDPIAPADATSAPSPPQPDPPEAPPAEAIPEDDLVRAGSDDQTPPDPIVIPETPIPSQSHHVEEPADTTLEPQQPARGFDEVQANAFLEALSSTSEGEPAESSPVQLDGEHREDSTLSTGGGETVQDDPPPPQSRELPERPKSHKKRKRASGRAFTESPLAKSVGVFLASTRDTELSSPEKRALSAVPSTTTGQLTNGELKQPNLSSRARKSQNRKNLAPRIDNKSGTSRVQKKPRIADQFLPMHPASPLIPRPTRSGKGPGGDFYGTEPITHSEDMRQNVGGRQPHDWIKSRSDELTSVASDEHKVKTRPPKTQPSKVSNIEDDPIRSHSNFVHLDLTSDFPTDQSELQVNDADGSHELPTTKSGSSGVSGACQRRKSDKLAKERMKKLKEKERTAKAEEENMGSKTPATRAGRKASTSQSFWDRSGASSNKRSRSSSPKKSSRPTSSRTNKEPDASFGGNSLGLRSRPSSSKSNKEPTPPLGGNLLGKKSRPAPPREIIDLDDWQEPSAAETKLRRSRPNDKFQDNMSRLKPIVPEIPKEQEYLELDGIAYEDVKGSPKGLVQQVMDGIASKARAYLTPSTRETRPRKRPEPAPQSNGFD